MFNLLFCFVLLFDEYYKWVVIIVILWLDDFVLKVMINRMVNRCKDDDDNDDDFEYVEDEYNFYI